jgi:hypothetical protein
MYCGIRVANVAANRVTRNETGTDEIYFVVSGGSAANTKFGTKVNRVGNPDIWEAGPGKPPPHHIMLWQGFIAAPETAALNVILREQDNSGTQLIGRFNVSVTVPSLATSRTSQPSFAWSSSSPNTSIIGSSNGSLATVSARETQADYLVTVAVDQPRSITSIGSTKCLDVADGSASDHANIQQFQCHGGPDQQWYPRLIGLSYQTAGSPPFPPPTRGELSRLYWTFALHAAHSGSCLDVVTTEGSRNVQQFSAHFGLNQQWFILPAQQFGQYFIISAWNGWALDVEGGSREDGGNVQVHPFHGGENQRWRISPPPLIDSTAMGDEVANLIRT